VELNGSRTLYTAYVSAANRYQWEFTSGSYLRRTSTSGSGLNLVVWATNPLQYGTTYNVRVRVSFDNGATYCSWGPICTITTAGAAAVTNLRAVDMADRSSDLAMWPNPNSDGLLHLTIEELGAELEAVDLTIYDMHGRLVHGERIGVDGSGLNTVADLRGRLPGGVYLVNVMAGERSYTKRLVIQ
jgi:hypothetical protein